jgi:hypothetical protein
VPAREGEPSSAQALTAIDQPRPARYLLYALKPAVEFFDKHRRTAQPPRTEASVLRPQILRPGSDGAAVS